MEFVKLSMPTKTAEYMISGVPICVLAPKDSALYKYAYEYNWAQTINSPNHSIIRTKLIEILENENLRQKLATNAMALAQKKHSIDVNKDLFYKLIINELSQETQN
jgi:glycosyltransferase involved in cell wall biosynthesis